MASNIPALEEFIQRILLIIVEVHLKLKQKGECIGLWNQKRHEWIWPQDRLGSGPQDIRTSVSLLYLAYVYVLDSFFEVINFKFTPLIIEKHSSWKLWGYIFTVHDGIRKSYFLLERLQGMNVMAQSTSHANLWLKGVWLTVPVNDIEWGNFCKGWGLGMLGTQNRKKTTGHTYTSCTHKTIVNVKCRSRMCHRSSESGDTRKYSQGWNNWVLMSE